MAQLTHELDVGVTVQTTRLVVSVLEKLKSERRLLTQVRMYHCREFTSKAMSFWSKKHMLILVASSRVKRQRLPLSKA